MDSREQHSRQHATAACATAAAAAAASYGDAATAGEVDAAREVDAPIAAQEVEDMEQVLNTLGTGAWNVVIWITCSAVSMVVPANVFYGVFVSPIVQHTCVPPDGAVATEDQCQYVISADDSSNTTSMHDCTHWLYDTSTYTLTATSQFDLVCHRGYLRALLASIYLTGSALGSPVGGYIADRFGRKRIGCVTLLLYSVLNLSVSWLVWIEAIVAVRFIMGFITSPMLVSCNSLVMEVCESRHRSAVGILNGLPWGLAVMVYGFMAYLIRDWRWLQFYMALQGLLLLPVLWFFVDESPRWLAVEGKHDEAMVVLQKAAKWNDIQLPPLSKLREVMRHTQEMKVDYHTDGGGLVRRVFKRAGAVMHKAVRMRMLIMITVYIATMMVYYGLTVGGASLNVNPFVYMILSGAMELPSVTLPAPLVSRYGRKLTTVVSYAICSVAILALAFIPSDLGWLIITVAMLGKLCITAAFQVIFLYLSELIPTEIRTSGLGTCMFFARAAVSVTPFIMDTLAQVIPWAPSVLMSVFSLLASLLTLKLPETKNLPMFDTLAGLHQHNRMLHASKQKSKSESCLEDASS